MTAAPPFTLPFPAPRAFERLEAMVAVQAERTPNEIAILHRGRRVRYRELAAGAAAMADRIWRAGIRPGMVVGVHAGRTPETVAAILGVLEAGAGYLPLDPGAPPDRLTWLLADSGAAAVVTDRPIAAGAPDRIVIDLLEPCRTAVRPLRPRPRDPGELACIFYTSGTTGEPKGVALAHTASRMVRWAETTFRDGELARMAATSGFGFDPSIFEMIAPLATGGTMILKDNVLDPFSAEEAPTMLQGVPSALAELVRAGRLPPSLRVLNVGGEQLPPELCAEIHRALPHVRIFNHYGPTEATICFSVAEIFPGTEPTLGRPICGAEAVIVGLDGRPLAPGEAGEITIRGETLALGYHRRPDLTAEKFVFDPVLGERSYRTGDRGRIAPDGTLRFLGRMGDQVKLRGVRVEPAEIEAAMMRLPRVSWAAAAVREDANGRARLVAYLPYSYAGGLSELRAALSATLPAIMLPAAMVRLTAPPRTAAGKLDRRALPDPPAANTLAGGETPEEAIAALFARLLNVEAIGIDDDFFDQGADSLMAVDAALRIEALTGRSVPAGLLIQAPTPRALALALDRRPRQGFAHVLPITPETPGVPIFATCDLHGRPTSVMGFAPYLSRPLLALVPGDDIADSDERVDLWAQAARYAAEIRRVQARGPYTLLGFSFGGPWAFAIASILEAEENERVTLVLIDPILGLRPGVSPTRLRRALATLIEEPAALGQGLAAAARKRAARAFRRAEPLPEFVPASAAGLAGRLLAATPAFRERRFGGRAVAMISTRRPPLERVMNDDDLLGWSRYLTGPTLRLSLDAAHDEMTRAPWAAEVAKQIVAAIA